MVRLLVPVFPNAPRASIAREAYPKPPPLDDDPDRLERARRSFEAREAELAKKERERVAAGTGWEASEKEKREEFIQAELARGGRRFLSAASDGS